MENPLKVYKEKHPEYEWEYISQKSGVPLQTMMSILKKDEDMAGGVTLATYVKLKKKLGVNLEKYYLSNK